MEAKDGSVGFGFAGTYTQVVPHQLIEMTLSGRAAVVEFIRETFDAEETHSVDQQRQDWLAILNRFPGMLRHVEKIHANDAQYVAQSCELRSE
jgi:hypothetical protein